MTAYFRVTVEDLETGEKQSREVAEGDYMVIPFGSCYLDGLSQYHTGTVQLTLRGWKPLGPPREVES